jgi:hypothetical protein
MRGAPSVASLGAERLANHGMELRTPLITTPPGRYQGAPALIPAVRWPQRIQYLGEDLMSQQEHHSPPIIWR